MSGLIQQGVKFMLHPLFIPSNLAVTPLAEKEKIWSMKPMGAVRHQTNPNLHYSSVAYACAYNESVCYDYLHQQYPKAKRRARVLRLRHIDSSLYSLISPEDIAKAALVFASDLSDYVTGDRLIVAGGFPYRFEDYGVPVGFVQEED
jgi:hypothetical protein